MNKVMTFKPYNPRWIFEFEFTKLLYQEIPNKMYYLEMEFKIFLKDDYPKRS